MKKVIPCAAGLYCTCVVLNGAKSVIDRKIIFNLHWTGTSVLLLAWWKYNIQLTFLICAIGLFTLNLCGKQKWSDIFKGYDYYGNKWNIRSIKHIQKDGDVVILWILWEGYIWPIHTWGRVVPGGVRMLERSKERRSSLPVDDIDIQCVIDNWRSRCMRDCKSWPLIVLNGAMTQTFCFCYPPPMK